MATIYREVMISASAGWQTVDLGTPITTDNRLTIIPLAKNLAPLAGQTGEETQLQVPATDSDGVPTGVFVWPGQILDFTASGTWMWHGSQPPVGPDGDPSYSTAPGQWGAFHTREANAYSLVGRVGAADEYWFAVGSSRQHLVLEGGQLYLGMNDNFFADNSGSLSVGITGGCKGIMPGELEDELVAQIGSGTIFAVGDQYDGLANASGTLKLSTNHYFAGTVAVLVILDAPETCEHEDGICPFAQCSAQATGNPIKLRDGDKVLSETDLTVQTPAGPLAFIRAYTQSKQSDSGYQFMGLGWTHNHAFKLTFSGTSPNRTAEVRLPNGGALKLDEDSGNAGHFDARVGSTTVLDYNSGTGRYTLTSQDKSTCVFDSGGNLLSRAWPGGETWTYTHAGGRLTEIDDGYGRKLKLSYISNPGQFDDGQLWRVGDHTASGLDGGSPSGRYVEFDYTNEKDNGVPVANAKALLSSALDVRGNTWSYDYYGQHEGETDNNKLNFLTRRLSPSVDMTGDGTADGAVTLEELSYIYNAGITNITQKRGAWGANDPLVETDFAFQPDGKNVTTEMVAGKTSVHHFADGVYAGLGNPAGQVPWQVIGDDYRALAQGDPNGHGIELNWSASGKHLEQVTDALDHETGFAYNNDDTLKTSQDAEGRKTLYHYGDADNSRLPTALLVSEDDDLAVNGGMEEDSDWTAVGTPATNVRFDKAGGSNYVYAGRYSRHVVADPDEGIEGNAWDLVAGKMYTVIARVYPVSGTVKMLVTSTSGFDRSSSGTDEWQMLYAVHTPAAGATGVKLQFIAQGGAAEFYVDSVVIINGPVLDWQEFSYDAKGRTLVEKTFSVDAVTFGALTQRTTRAYYTSGEGNGLLHTDTQEDLTGVHNDVTITYVYDTFGRVVQTNQSTTFGSCTKSRTVYDSAGNVVASLCNFEPGTNDPIYPETVEEARALRQRLYDEQDPDHYTDPNTNRLTIHVYDELGRRVETVSNAEDPYEQATRTVYDALGRVLRTVQSYDPTGVGDNVAEWVWDEVDGRWEDKNGVAIPHGDDYTRNLIADTAYNERGMIRMGRDTLGNVILYGYDDDGRLVKAVQNASVPGYDNSCAGDFQLSVYDRVDVDGAGASYSIGRDGNNAEVQAAMQFTPPLDGILALFKFTLVGNFGLPSGGLTWEVRADNNNLPTGALLKSGTIASPVQSIENVVDVSEGPALSQTAKYWLLLRPTGSMGANNYWRWARSTTDVYPNHVSAQKVGASWGTPSATDLNFEVVIHNPNPDEDIVTAQQYNAAGSLVKSTDMADRVAFTVYDPLNRPVKAVRSASQPDYDIVVDPGLSDYDASSETDHDIITVQEHDAMGRVIRTQNAAGAWTLYGCDELGRQVKVVRNASNPTYDIAGDPDLSGYSASSDPDKDLVTLTEYDDHGRVRDSVDEAERRARYGYDGFGRQTTAVQNFDGVGIDGDVALWVWDAVQGRWEDKDGVAIPHGQDDTNVVSRTVYDDDGRVQSTRDALGRVTWNVYDAAGRQVRAVRNYDATGLTHTDPADWVWVADHWEDGDGHTVVSGDNDDLNVVTETAYDDQGRVTTTTDARRNLTRYSYDALGRRVRAVGNWVDNGEDPALWVWDAGDVRWEESDGTPIDHGTDSDQNLVSDTDYDLGGRVSRTRDAAGVETCYEYDAAGRRVKTIANYVDGVYSANRPDEDVITETVYNKAGQVLATIDARGTKTAFTYDAASRRLTVTGAAETPLAAVSYTCYDKGGRVLRVITNWIEVEGEPSPDARDENGGWLFAPETHGPFEDRDLVTAYVYDAAGRRALAVQNVYFDGIIDTDLRNWGWSAANARWEDGSGHPIPTTAHGDRNIVTQTVYEKAGQVVSERDPVGVLTRFVYDGLRHLRRVVQSWVDNGEDPAEWVWDANDVRWEESDGTPIDHGDDHDHNVIVVVDLDQAGRRESLCDPRGNLTTYAHDALGRRTELTNPLDETWATTYSNLAGGTRTELTDPKGDVTRRDTDRLGRLMSIGYLDENPKLTPDVEFEYDLAGNRVKMTESGGRETEYVYDAMRRLVAVTFDDGQTEQTVQYAYDASGLRTRLTLPDGLSITYTYDVRGQLVSLTDWDRQTMRFAHDLAGRLIAATRSSGLRSRYAYDAGGRLRLLRHSAGRKTLGHFAFEVDARGNRTRAFECVPHPITYPPATTTIAYDDDAIAYRGAWADEAPYKVTTEATASLQVTCFGGAEDHLTLTLGTGPDHGICDVYVGNSFWQSFNLYNDTQDDKDEEIPVTGEGPHVIEVRNRAEKDTRSSGYKLRFKSLTVDRTYDLHTTEYTYDALSRLLSADYRPGANLNATPFRQYEYTYDLAGNRTQQIITIDSTPTTTNYTYNDANQLTSDGTNTYTYDNNGNLLGDGVNSYTWDRANRLLSFGGASYKYDGLGNRVQQTVNSIITSYLLETQPGLVVVLQSMVGSDVTRFIHGPRGLHAQQQPNGEWVFPMQDALGSVRGVADANLAMLESRLYAPYGAPFGVQGTSQTVYGFTGEPTDANDLVYLRARYLNPGLGVFASHDPVCGEIKRVMSLNGYSWVEGNVINAADPSGEIFESITRWDKCASAGLPYQQGKACGEVPTGRAKQMLDLRDEDMVLLALNIPFESQVWDRKVQNEEMIQRIQTIVWLSRVYRNKITVSEALTGSRNYAYGAFPKAGQTSWREEFTKAFIGEYRRPPDPEELRNPSPAVVQALWENPITPVDDTRGLCKVVEKAIEEWGNDYRYWFLYYFGHWEDSDLELHNYGPYTINEETYYPLQIIAATTGDKMRHVCCDMLYIGRRYGEWQSPGFFLGYRGSKKTIFASSHLQEVVNYPVGVKEIEQPSLLADYQSACDPGHRWYREARPMDGVYFAGSETDVCREECKDGQGLWWFPNPECHLLAQ